MSGSDQHPQRIVGEEIITQNVGLARILKKGFQQSPMFDQAFKNIDDILRKQGGCTTELDYTEQD